MHKTIDFIYFDVGGVVILDFSKTNKWQEMVEELVAEEEKRKAFSDLFLQAENDICRGTPVETFIEKAKKELKVAFRKDYSMLDDFASRYEVNASIHELLNEIKSTYRVGLLTNMYPGLFDAIEKRALFPNVSWDTIIDSSVVGFKKPEKEIFQIAEKEAHVKPENILFIDNSEGHVDAAQEHGWQAMVYDPEDVEGSNRRLRKLVIE